MSDQRQDWAELRREAEEWAQVSSGDVLDLLAEVDRLTEALEAAVQDCEEHYAEARQLYERAERAEGDLVDERRRHAERVEWLAGHEWSGGYFCACGHELNSPRGYLAHLRALLCQNDAMPPVDYVENLPHLLSDTTTDADEPMSELR